MGFLYRKFVGGEETELECVLRNLRYVLGARRGAASVLPDFGLSALAPRTPEGLFEWMNHEVREVITRYEPRVEIVALEEEYDDDGRPNLKLHLRMRSTQEDLRLLLDPRRREVSPPPADPDED